MREEMLKSLKTLAQANVDKHRMNVEVFLNKPVGVGEHSDIMETIEKELNSMSTYMDQIEVLDKYF